MLRDELIALARRADRLGGDALAIDGEYLESVGERTQSAVR